MKKQRRIHSAEFKATVALLALKGLNTISKIAAKHEVFPVQFGTWKKGLLEHVPETFDRKPTTKPADAEKEKSDLKRKVRQLTMAVDFSGASNMETSI